MTSIGVVGTGAEQQGVKEGKQYRWGAPYNMQLRILLQRTLKTRRFEALSSRDFLQFLIVGVLAGELQPAPSRLLHGASYRVNPKL